MAITQVGATVSGAVNNGQNITLTLPTMLDGDLVILICGQSLPHGGAVSEPMTGTGPSTAGYTAILDSHTDSTPATADTDKIALGAWRKFMGATPDANVVALGNGSTANGTVAHAIVLRGADQTTPVEVVSTMNRTGTGAPAAPAVTVVTVGAWTFAVGGLAVNDATVTAPTGYTGLAWSTFSETNPIALGFAYKEAASAGSENPAAFSGVTVGTHSGAFTFAVKPASGGAPNTGTAAGALAFAGAASGKRVAKAASSGTVTFAGTASGTTVRRGTGAGSLAFTGSATGKRTPKGSSNGTLAFVGTSTGRRTPKAAGSGSLAFTGSAVGSSPSVGVSEGTAVGSLAFVGSAVGKRTPKASTSGAVAFVGSAVGRRSPVGSGGGSLSVASLAVGFRQPVATAVGTLTFAGLAVGTSDIAPPTDFEGRILSARLSILAVTVRLATPAASGDLSTVAASGVLDTAEVSARLSVPQATGVLT